MPRDWRSLTIALELLEALVAVGIQLSDEERTALMAIAGSPR
jgi:hypothetical protein